ncbi:hypothetical protein JYU34_017798 [Plutella xylostella]|uniref:CPR type cuticle protein n=1 Tax=Plutella xylostella TaxID=51655 RepID=A0ABQ7Q254_PLUXY|nr:hypothetical protein JYU34_017798 [Plutella xylostella]
MRWFVACVLCIVAVSGGGGVTKQPGIAQFWTDDYKVFEHIYGRTSDRELFGATVPPTLAYGVDPTRFKIATDKKELTYDEEEDTTAQGSHVEPGYKTNYDTGYEQREPEKTSYGYHDNYAAVVAKQQYLKSLEKEVKPTKPSFKFLGYGDFKPISQANDPDTYQYMKHLEALQKQEAIGFPQESVKGFFKPAVTYSLNPQSIGVPVTGLSGHQNILHATNPENTDAYKSIQDILNAHEAKKSKNLPKYGPGDDVKYITYGSARSKKPVRLVQGNDISKSYRCASGSTSPRCRKRAVSSPPRVRTRQVIRKIKHTIVNDDD